MESVTVFGQAAIANLAVAKGLFDVPEWVLDLGTGAGFELLGLQLTVVQLLARAGALCNKPGYILAILMLIPLLNPKITRITEHALLVAMKKVASGHDVVNVGCCSIDAVDQPKRVVHANVHLHAKVILIALLGLVHLRVTLAALVLRGAWSRNDGSIHNAAFAQHQTVLLQVFVHLLEQHLAQAMAFKEMTKLENGGFIRQAIQLQAGEVPHGFNLIQGVFHGRVAEVIKQLHAVNSQHGGQRIGWPASLALRVISGHLLLQLLPGNQLVHPFQKDLATSFALLVLVLGFGEGDLIHGGNESYAVDDDRIIADFETYSESPKISPRISIDSHVLYATKGRRK